MYQNKPYYLIFIIMKNQLTLILITSLLTTFSLKLYAEEVTKIEINVYTTDGVETTTIDTNSDLITISTDSQLTNSLLTKKSFDTKKQSKYYLSTGFGKIKDDVVANLSVGYQLFPNLSAEAGLITSAEVHSISSSSSTTSGTTDGKAYSITANAGLKTASNTSYLLGVNYSIPVFSNRPNTVPFPKLMPNLQINNNNLEFYSKAGVLFWGVDYSLYLDGTITFDGTTYSPNGSIPFAAAKGSNFYYGIGLSYPLTNEASIRTEYFNSKIAGIKFGGLTSSAVFKF
jgi:hypothetical protein